MMSFLSKNPSNNSRHTVRFKTRRRYRLAFINENTFNEVWTIKMSRPKVILSVLLIIAAVGCIVATLIVFTPLRTLLPGYLKHSQRLESMINDARLDSLTTEAEINNAYIANIHSILSGDIDTTLVATTDTVAAMPIDSLPVATEAEKEFVRNFEEREKYNLSVLSPQAAGGLAFYPPVTGGTIVGASEGELGQRIASPRGAGVSAVYSGTVVDARYTPDEGYSVVVQHPDEFISTYRGLASLFVAKGDRVESGARLGLAPSARDTKGIVTVELWRGGTPLVPSDYIPF